MAKKTKKKQNKSVDHTEALKSDLKRVALWGGISLGITTALAVFFRSVT
ncbi:hypothetical protein [Melghirimyces algeriensis]|nr:hypothetical protein [Melghirimyces algeriensis]